MSKNSRFQADGGERKGAKHLKMMKILRSDPIKLLACLLVLLIGQAHAQIAVEAGAVTTPEVAARRARLMEAHGDGIIIVPSQYRAGQSTRDNLNFLYLTGIREPDAVLVLDLGGTQKEILFRRRGGGGRGGPGIESGPGAATQAAPSPALIERPVDQLTQALRGAVMSGRAKRVLLPFSDLDFLARAFGDMNPLTRAEVILNLDPTLHEMRMVKDTTEIRALREAVDLTARALNEAYRAAAPGMIENDLAAILKYTFNRAGTTESFLQAASGPNSTNVHFGATSRALEAGDMIVFDVGAYVRGYTSDISRTIPVSGRFSKPQRAIYELVLAAQEEGCRRLVPGVTFKAVQDEVERMLMAGLAELGLVTDAKSAWQKRLYIQHGFGHGIGLDIHDSWTWHSPRLGEVAMAPGMVMTMEPGLYFPEGRLEAFLAGLKGKVPEAELEAFRERVGPVYATYAGFGVRVEDDVLITEGGNEILSAGVPKDVAAIEKMMREKSRFSGLGR